MSKEDPNKFQNILNEQIQANLATNTRAKLLFLQDEKERLETAIQELQINNNLLRNINKQITSSLELDPSALLSTLNQQNSALEGSYARILKENEHMSSQILLLHQIMDETGLENQTIIKEYEAKIIELRRAIQIKQVSIQELEKKINPTEPANLSVPPTNVTVLFFNQIDELKNVIDRLTTRNRQLEAENAQIQQKKQFFQKKLQLMEALTLKSKLMFEEFKHFYCDDKRRYSAPKKDTYIPLTFSKKMAMKNLNQGLTKQTREISECQPSRIDNSLKMLLYKEILKVDQLSQKIEILQHKVQAEHNKNQILTASYNSESKKVSELNKELTYCRYSNNNLLRYIGKRRDFVSRSAQKTKEDQLIADMKTDYKAVTKHSERKLFWTAARDKLKPDRMKLIQIKKRHRNVKRSLSSTNDYRMAYHQEQPRNTANKRVENRKGEKKMEEDLGGNFDDLSFLMQDPMLNEISIIGPSTQVKTSYAQWKKKKELPNLTVMEENIL